MTVNPLDALPTPSPYPRTSRYHDVETSVHVAPDGRRIPYLGRRLLPAPAAFTAIAEHVVSEGERPELVADRHFGDPGQWWRVADANGVLHPRDLTAVPGRRVRVTLPAGVPAPAEG